MEDLWKMADEGTAATLVLVSAILQLLIAIAFLALGGLGVMAAIIFMEPWILLIPAIILAMGIPGFIFMILWFSWRSEPCVHKTGLIVTGVLGIIFAGFLPGLLVLIAGMVCPSEAA